MGITIARVALIMHHVNYHNISLTAYQKSRNTIPSVVTILYNNVPTFRYNAH